MKLNETPEGFKQYYLFDHSVDDPKEFKSASVFTKALSVTLQNFPDSKGKTYYMYTAAKTPRFAGIVKVHNADSGHPEFDFIPEKQKDSKVTPYTNEKPLEPIKENVIMHNILLDEQHLFLEDESAMDNYFKQQMLADAINSINEAIAGGPQDESKKDKDKLVPVFILIMHSGEFGARAIHKLTGALYTHSAITFDTSLTHCYAFANKQPENGENGWEFHTENIYKTPVFTDGRDIPIALYCVPVTSEERARMKDRVNYFIKNKTKFRYDYPGLFNTLFKINVKDSDRYICSGFVADVLNAGRPDDPFFKQPRHVKPNDFRSMDFTKLVISTYMKSYDRKKADAKVKEIIEQAEAERAKGK